MTLPASLTVLRAVSVTGERIDADALHAAVKSAVMHMAGGG